MLRIGIIGAGQRAAHIFRTAQKLDREVTLAVVADPDADQARAALRDVEVEGLDNTRFVPNVEALVELADGLDGLIIGSRCDLHTPLALAVAQTGLPVFMEKPVAVDAPQLAALAAAYAGRSDQIVVSFPLSVSPLFKKAMGIVRHGRLGKINQVTAFNYVPYGGVYFGQWYRDYETTGGMWLQKATHDFDYISKLSLGEPTRVVAMETQNVYGGKEPEGLRCSSCDLASTCLESPQNIKVRGDDGGMGTEDHLCAFSESIENHDAGSAIVMYDNHVHASYTQNFVSRRSAFSRGARVTGYNATLEFDWATEQIRVIEHHGYAVEEISVNQGEDHHGGDTVLARNFIDVIRGNDLSQAPLIDGLRSAAICLAARAAAKSDGGPRPIQVPGATRVQIAARVPRPRAE